MSALYGGLGIKRLFCSHNDHRLQSRAKNVAFFSSCFLKIDFVIVVVVAIVNLVIVVVAVTTASA